MTEPFSLSDEEIELLLTPINFDDLDVIQRTKELTITDAPMISFLSQATDAAIDAYYADYHFRFPLRVELDSSLKVGTPAIYERHTDSKRLWRLNHPQGLQLLDEDNQPIIATIINLSAGGILLRCHHPQSLIDDHWSAYLVGFDVDILLTGLIRRKEPHLNYTDVAIQLQLDHHALQQMQKLIYTHYQQEHPDFNLDPWPNRLPATSRNDEE